MNTSHRSRHLLLLALALSAPSLALAAPGRTPGGYCYPFDGVRTEADLSPRLMSGGCWLSGLPGKPAYKSGHIHAGVDLRADLGETIYAVAPGVVDAESDTPHSGYGPGWTTGRVLIVRCTLADGTPFLTVYGHTQNHLVQGGQTVQAGQPLAEVGPWLAAEGGPHLHLTIRLGELPRFGWGTPTLAPGPARDGAELAGCPAEVEALGYRNPLEFLRGRCAPPATAASGPAAPGSAAAASFPSPTVPARPPAVPPADPPPAPTTPAGRIGSAEQFAARAAAYWRSRDPGKAPQALADEFTRSNKPVRYGNGWCQTYRSGARKGALLTAAGGQEVCWVPEPVWTIYNLKGGAEALGAPRAEAQDWPEAHAQGFDKALLVIEKKTDRVLVIWRK